MDVTKAEQAIKSLLKALDIETSKHYDIENTPKRAVKMLCELWEGERYTNQEIAKMYAKTFPANCIQQEVTIEHIKAFSYCEHHLALIYDMDITVSYIPKDKVIGLSKIPRIVQMCCHRLQLQEKIGADILEVIQIATEAESIKVEIIAKHSCVTARGIKERDAETKTVITCGKYQ